MGSVELVSLSVAEKEMLWMQAVDDFNHRRFYDCHEHLETLWRDAEDQIDKDFYQGILMIAVGCYHLENQNKHGAVKKLMQGLERLERINTQHNEADLPCDINLKQFSEQAKCLLESIEHLEKESLREVNIAKLQIFT